MFSLFFDRGAVETNQGRAGDAFPSRKPNGLGLARLTSVLPVFAGAFRLAKQLQRVQVYPDGSDQAVIVFEQLRVIDDEIALRDSHGGDAQRVCTDLLSAVLRKQHRLRPFCPAEPVGPSLAFIGGRQAAFSGSHGFEDFHSRTPWDLRGAHDPAGTGVDTRRSPGCFRCRVQWFGRCRRRATIGAQQGSRPQKKAREEVTRDHWKQAPTSAMSLREEDRFCLAVGLHTHPIALY